MYPFNITELTDAKDIEEVVQVWIEGSRTAHAFIGAEYWLKQANTMREIYLPNSETWIYRDPNGKIVGFASFVNNQLAALFIHPDQQGKGIGSKLMQWAKELRNELHLTVYTKNEKAVNFYLQHHFKIKWQQIDENTGEAEFYMEWIKSKR